MDIWSQLLGGFATAGTPINLLWALLGCTIGTAVGVLVGVMFTGEGSAGGGGATIGGGGGSALGPDGGATTYSGRGAAVGPGAPLVHAVNRRASGSAGVVRSFTAVDPRIV